jgi:hypothetical protein
MAASLTRKGNANGEHRHLDPELRVTDHVTTVASLQAFAEFVRCGSVGQWRQVGTQTVQVTLRSIGAHFELDARLNPCYCDGNTPKYWKVLEQQIKGCRRQDPVPQAKLAFPVMVPHWCVSQGIHSSSPRTQAIGNLTNSAFYYLLHIGEYTYHGAQHTRCTKQFRACDTQFWKNGAALPLNSPPSVLLSADVAQKNGKKGAVIHQEALFEPHCPVQSLARRVIHILAFPSDLTTPLSVYFTHGHLRHVLASHINSTVKASVCALKLHICGFSANLVSSHSIRAGGAMAMKLNGENRDTICKHGCWSSDTFLMYIHKQIAAFSSGISKRMSRHIPFINLKGPTLLSAIE